MNEHLKRVYFASHVFYYSAKSQLKKRDTLELAVLIGLASGLKLNLGKAVKTGIAVAGVISVINGVSNVVEHWAKIKNL